MLPREHIWGSARLRSFGRDHVRDLRRTLQLKTLHLRLQHPVRIGDPLVLAQMLKPTIDQKRLDEACWVGRIQAPSRRRSRPRRSSAARNARRLAGSIRYSTVTSTGPRSSWISWLTTGAAQCSEGVRSTLPPVCRCQRHAIGIARSAPAAAMKWASGRPHTVATCPHSALPAVCAPK